MAAIYTRAEEDGPGGRGVGESRRAERAARGGGNADSLYSAGIGLWNANKFAEAQADIRSGAQSQPQSRRLALHARQGYLNLGKMKEAAGEFETYLKLEPTGKNAAEAKTTFEALKPMLK